MPLFRPPVRLGVFLVSALVAAGAVLALGSRSDLEDARGRADQAWSVLRAELDWRYEALGAAGEAAGERLGDGSSLLADLESALAAWRSGLSVEAQVAAANRLEGLVARLEATAAATPRLRTSDELAGAVAAVGEADPGDARGVYNEAVAAYEQVRGAFPRRLVAGAMGFDPLPTLEVPA